MRVITVHELAGLTACELMSIRFQVEKQQVGTRIGSPERLAVERVRKERSDGSDNDA
jgi:hypothetical protein